MPLTLKSFTTPATFLRHNPPAVLRWNRGRQASRSQLDQFVQHELYFGSNRSLVSQPKQFIDEDQQVYQTTVYEGQKRFLPRVLIGVNESSGGAPFVPRLSLQL